jgi:hypothetical protein
VKRGPRRPRPPIAVAPLAISTETCLQLGGITDRKMRDALARYPEIARSRIGHTLLVTPEAFAELLERTRVTEGDVAGVDQVEDDDQPTSVDDVLRRIGKERVA